MYGSCVRVDGQPSCEISLTNQLMDGNGTQLPASTIELSILDWLPSVIQIGFNDLEIHMGIINDLLWRLM